MSMMHDALHYFEEQKDLLRERALGGIEKYRKGDLKIKAVNADGTPAKNVSFSVEQKKHEFKFGANIFMLGEFETAEKNEIYKEKFSKIFNLATVPFYWNTLEPEEGKTRYDADSEKIYRRPPTDLCVDYCLKNGIEPKCHCLNYDMFIPEWLKGVSEKTYFEKLEKRFSEISGRYADTIPTFEVINEQFYPYWDPKASASYFTDGFVRKSFVLAEKYFGKNKLIINDFVISEPGLYNERTTYFLWIYYLLSQGCRIDTIGFQYHNFFEKGKEASMADSRYNPGRIYKLLDLYAKLGREMQITEMTIPAYSSDEEDEYVQAKLTEYLYTIMFGYPNMNAVIYWNVPDGYAAFAPMGDMNVGENVYYGGLLRFDMSEKPVYKTLDRLINHEWHTSENGIAEDGEISLRGFYGEYEVTVRNGKNTSKKDIRFLKDGENSFTIEI